MWRKSRDLKKKTARQGETKCDKFWYTTLIFSEIWSRKLLWFAGLALPHFKIKKGDKI